MGALSLIANKVNVRAFLNTFHGPLLDRMERSSDVGNLGNWLSRNFRLKFPLIFGFILGPVLGVLLFSGWNLSYGISHGVSPDTPAPLHIGSSIAVILSCMEAMWVGYYLYPFYLMFPPELRRYQFDLYAPDPSSSEWLDASRDFFRSSCM
jgi:hypothetical protein